MGGAVEADLRGASPDAVTRALDAGDPFPGGRGFAGLLSDGRLVRDVLGREPLFVDGADWSHDPSALSSPDPFPAGHVSDGDGPRLVWSLTDPDPAMDALDDLRAALDGALADLRATDNLAVAFSGGVDSALVASVVDAPLYVAGFPDGRDVAAAREAAAAMGRAPDLRVVNLDHDTLAEAVPTVARAVRRTNAMDVSIALPLSLVAARAAADGHERLALGQGADELFGGYEKVANAPDDDRVRADTVRGARREQVLTLPDQLERDVLAVRDRGVEPVAPFLDDRVVRAALSLPADLLVRDGERKVALRRVARDRLPASVATREKTAVQYGSLSARELDRLARQAGFKRRLGDHVSKYVAWRLDDG